ncbi:MAG: Crp/Fnr family transcriptional regulator [Proteobacteria bacterium]|nr:Crp/Fnr family transcriptional regulator [Pseudomonadota bacterium]
MVRCNELPPGEAIRILRSNRVFSVLDDQVLARLCEVACRQLFGRGERVVRQGDRCSELFIVEFGYLKAFSAREDGDDTIYSVMGPTEVFGELAFFGEGTRSADVTTLASTGLVALSAAPLQRTLASSTALMAQLAEVSVGRVRRLSQKHKDASRSVQQRLAACLLDFAGRFGSERSDGSVRIPFRLTQQEFGDYIGATREFVNRHLRDWEREGLLRKHEGGLVISDPTALEPIP